MSRKTFDRSLIAPHVLEEQDRLVREKRATTQERRVMDEEELCLWFERRAERFQNALEQIAKGSITAANGVPVKMTAFRMSQIASAALRARANPSLDD